jgi:hypothetical protein
MPEENIHSLVLQLSRVAQQYEKYWEEVEVIAKKYEGLPMWVQNILGSDMTSAQDIRDMLSKVTVDKDTYVATIRQSRNFILRLAQALAGSENDGTGI